MRPVRQNHDLAWGLLVFALTLVAARMVLDRTSLGGLGVFVAALVLCLLLRGRGHLQLAVAAGCSLSLQGLLLLNLAG